MSRKHYREAARIIREADYLTTEARRRLVSDLVTMFADDNPRFSASKFRDACEPVTRLSCDYEALRDDGYAAGVAAGSWVVDGNTSEDVAREILRMLDDGDPQVYDAMPTPLSGEWADDPTPADIFARCGVADVEPDEMSELLDYWTAGYGLGWETEVVRCARAMLGLFPSDLRR